MVTKMKKSSRFWVEESFNKLNPRCWRVFSVQSHSSGLPFKVQTPSRFAYKVPGLIGMEALYKKAKFKILFPWAARGPSAGAQHSSKRHVKMETSSLTWWMVLVLEGGWVGGWWWWGVWWWGIWSRQYEQRLCLDPTEQEPVLLGRDNVWT